MRARIAVLACVVLCGHAVAEPKYAVDGLVLGSQLNFQNASYGEYGCSPSAQFDGLTWCQKTPRIKSDTTTYSLLHSREGTIFYINRAQEVALLNAKKAEEDIQKSSNNIGEFPRVMKMPHRGGFPDGIIAVWGKVTLEQLDQESINLLADRKRLKQGLLIDFLGNFVRSAKAGLPVYRIDGGPGFVWAASFDQKGHGILRLGAVDASKFLLPLVEQQPTAQMSEASEAKPEFTQKNEKVQPELRESTAPVVDPETKAAAERVSTEDARVGTNEMTQPELADGTVVIADPESKAAAERAQIEDAKVGTNEMTQPEPADGTVVIADPESKAAAERAQIEDAKVGTNEMTQPEPADGTVVIADPESKAAAERAQTEDARVGNNEESQPERTDANVTIVNPEEATAQRAQTEDARERNNEKELTDASETMVDLENKSVAERPQTEAARERTNLDAVRAPLKSKDQNTGWLETMAYGSIVSLLFALTVSELIFYRRRQKASALKGRALLHRADLIEAAAESTFGDALSPGEGFDKIEAIRQSLLLDLTSSPGFAPSRTLSSKGQMRTDPTFHGWEPRSLEKA
jgi:RNA polymerase subunit RPABC4/transcription elongation factor Spt4